MPDAGELSEGWILEKLETAGEWSTGGTPLRSKPEYFNGSIPWIKITDLNDGIVTKTEKKITELGLQNSNAKILPKGTICVGIYGSIGKIGILGIAAATNQACGNCIVDEKIVNPKFLFYYILSERKKLLERGRGGTQANINNKILRDWPLPLPPLHEQQRIVARVEAPLSHVNAARERVSRVPLIMKKFRQAVLAAACEGRLTEGWREKHNDRFENDSIAQIVQKNASNKKIVRDFAWNLENNYPENWLLTYLDILAKVDTGTTPSRKNPDYWNGGTIPWVTSGELYNSFVTKTNEKVTEQALKETRLKIFPKGTLLIALYGQGLTRGTSSELAIEATTNQACGTINILDDLSEIKPYIKLLLQKNYFDIRNLSAGGVQPNLNLSKIKAIPVPLPPLAEQHEIVRHVGLLFEHADAIDREVEAAGRRCERLTQAVLAKAFAGKL